MTRDEFENSIFELADQWTSSADRDEYVEFLELGYKKVFAALDDADALRFPSEWEGLLKCATTITSLPPNKATEFAVGVLSVYATQTEGTLAALVVDELSRTCGGAGERPRGIGQSGQVAATPRGRGAEILKGRVAATPRGGTRRF